MQSVRKISLRQIKLRLVLMIIHMTLCKVLKDLMLLARSLLEADFIATKTRGMHVLALGDIDHLHMHRSSVARYHKNKSLS